MRLIRVPDDLVSRLMIASNRRGEPLMQYITEILEQAVRAHELNSSLKEIVDSYEKEVVQKEASGLEEAERVEESSVREVFERLLAEKLGPRIEEKTSLVSEEREMLERFLSKLSERSRREEPKEKLNEKECAQERKLEAPHRHHLTLRSVVNSSPHPSR